MKKYLIPALILLLAVCSAKADDKNGQQALKDFHQKEKMLLSPKQIIEFMKSKKSASEYLSKKSKKYAAKLEGVKSGYVSSNSIPEAEVHAAVNPANPNNIVASPIRQNPNNMLKSLTCPIFYTTDAGESWNESDFETFTQSENGIPMGGGDPMFTFDADGNLYFSWIYLYGDMQGMSIDSLRWGVYWAYSKDGGVSFQAESYPIIGNAKGATDFNGGQPNINEFHDKQWLAADMSNSQYRNNVYASMVAITEEEGYMMQLFTKEAGKPNFNYEPLRISPAGISIVQFGSLDVDNKGWVHIMFYGEVDGTASMFHAVSKDGGKSIAKVTKISNFYGTDPIMLNENADLKPDGLSRLYPAPNLVADKSGGEFDGYLYTTWTAYGVNSDEGNGLDIYFSKSTDGGETWSDAVILNDNTENTHSHQFYSAHMVSPDGTYAVAWYDRREDINNLGTHYYYTFSKDGGKTFDNNKAVTTLASDFSKIGSKNNNFGVGEYNQLIITDTYFMPIWADGRSNDGNVNIMFAKESFTGVQENLSFGQLNSGISSLSVSPMPISDKATLKAEIKEDGNYLVEVYSIDGEKVFEMQKLLSAGNIAIDLNFDLSAGTYFLKVSNDKSYIGTKIVLK